MRGRSRWGRGAGGAGGGRQEGGGQGIRGLAAALEELLDDSTRGDPHVAAAVDGEVGGETWPASCPGGGTGAGRTRCCGYCTGRGTSTQGNSMTIEGRAAPGPGTPGFRYTGGRAGEHLAAGRPRWSAWTPGRKSRPGSTRRKGREWRPEGDPVRVRDHGLPGQEPGKVTPYGVYGHRRERRVRERGPPIMTPRRFRRWSRCAAGGGPRARAGTRPRRRAAGHRGMPAASNGYRTRGVEGRAWPGWPRKRALEINGVPTSRPARRSGNKIEHRLFCQITRNWRARPLGQPTPRSSLEAIAATTRQDPG